MDTESDRIFARMHEILPRFPYYYIAERGQQGQAD